MVSPLFVRRHVLARMQSGPLLDERLRYLAYRTEQGMARQTLREMAQYLPVIARYLRLADRAGKPISRAEIEEQAILWAAQPHRQKPAGSARARKAFRRHACAWLTFLGWLQPATDAPHRYAAEIAAFAAFLKSEKGLAFSTIEGQCSLLRRLLDRLCPGTTSLHSIGAEQIDEAILGQAREGKYARNTVHHCATALRTFLRFAGERGWCRAGLAAAIHTPRLFTQTTIPFGPSWEEVRKLLALTETDRPDDIRDRALFLLLAVYGLRAGELTKLRLEDFDWERELVTVTSSKTGRARTYPLAGFVGEAVLRYLKEVRPRTALREVFLSRNAPRRALDRTSLYVIVARRLRTVCPSLPRHGPHALRHACATHLLEQGLSLKEIGDHLGHRHPDTTRVYAKVDLAQLRQVGDVDLGGVL